MYISKLFSCKIQPLHRHSQPFTRVLRMSRKHPKMKLLNRPSIAFIDYISYQQLIDRRLIIDIPNVYACMYVHLNNGKVGKVHLFQ